jgi:hypothetical protein
MLAKVTRLEKLGGFKLRVRFTDGSEGVHDFSALVKEAMKLVVSQAAAADLARLDAFLADKSVAAANRAAHSREQRL